MNSELRQDPVSRDWVVIVESRAKKPEEFLAKTKRAKAPKQGCPFEDPEKSGNEVVRTYGTVKAWLLKIIKNKYPALTHQNTCPRFEKRGPYAVIEGVGHHELVIVRDHNLNFPHLSKRSATLVFFALQERYKALAEDPCTEYISIFHNWGRGAGASIYHPHYQILTLPVIPPAVAHSIYGSLKSFRKNKKCAHCQIITFEKKVKRRIIYENKQAIVFAPFVSREPFELRVFPKKHEPYFEEASSSLCEGIVAALQHALRQIEVCLRDPDYNFFIHTAPVKHKERHKSYHWHIEILPKISISAGFELGTGIEITAVDPDEAAALLRSSY